MNIIHGAEVAQSLLNSHSIHEMAELLENEPQLRAKASLALHMHSFAAHTFIVIVCVPARSLLRVPDFTQALSKFLWELTPWVSGVVSTLIAEADASSNELMSLKFSFHQGFLCLTCRSLPLHQLPSLNWLQPALRCLHEAQGSQKARLQLSQCLFRLAEIFLNLITWHAAQHCISKDSSR